MAPAGTRQAGLTLHKIGDLKRYFEGAWTVERTVRDRRAASDGTFRGEATFMPTREGLRYDETGRLELPGYTDDVSRCYRWIIDDPHRAAILFEDGRPFHALDLTNGEDRVRHLCGDDVYDGIYAVEDDGNWQLAWRIEGPRKSLLIESRYTRRQRSP